jgi:hypothetical protein
MKTAERTIERPRVERVVETPAKRRSAVTLIAVIIALALGLLGGFLLRGSDDVDPTAPVTVDGVELTERQDQMFELVDDYVTAWQNGDGEAAAEMFQDMGRLVVWGVQRDVTEFIDTTPTPGLRILEPVLVNDNEMLMFHTIDGTTFSNVMSFTTTGELLITMHEIVR